MSAATCQACKVGRLYIDNARGDLGDLKTKLVRAQSRGDEQTYVDQAAALKAKLRDAEERHAAHQYAAHGIGTDLNDGKPSFTNLHTKAYRGPAAELPPIADMLVMLEDGWTTGRIAEEYGCSASTVSSRLRDGGYGIEDRRKAAKATEPEEETPAAAFAGLRDADWMDDALCAQVDPELFFPEKGGSSREPKSVCARCPVSAECLDWALENHERYGVWGGLSERERRDVARLISPDAPAEPRNRAASISLFEPNGDPLGVCGLPDCGLPTYADKYGKPRQACGRSHAQKLGHLNRQNKPKGDAA